MATLGSDTWTTHELNFRFQREWGGAGRRLFIVLAFYFGGAGAGTYLVSVLADFVPGALLGIGIVGIGKSAAHILFLGRPARFWRAMTRPHSSWISRGVIFFTLFVLSALAYLWVAAASALSAILFWLSLVSAFLTILYSGLLLNRTAIPLWRQSLVPVLFVVMSLASGANLSALLGRLFAQESLAVETFDPLAFWGAIIMLGLLAIFLWNAYGADPASRHSMRWWLTGKEGAWCFYGLFLAVGLLFPIGAHLFGEIFPVPKGLLLSAYLGEAILGAYVFRHLILRGGVFRPIV